MMAVATRNGTRLTSDPVAPEQLRADIARLFDALAGGGIGIVPLDVAYAVVATTPSGIRRIFEVKRRSYEKPSGMFGNWRHEPRDPSRWTSGGMPWSARLVEQEKIPFSVVAPFRTDHPLLAGGRSLRDGRTHRRAARSTCCSMPASSTRRSPKARSPAAPRCLARRRICRSPAANIATRISSQPIRDAAAIHFDYGQSKYAHKDGLSSTIIDLPIFSVIRVGHCFERLKRAFATRFGVTLKN